MKAAVAEFFAKQGRGLSTAETAVDHVVEGMFQLYDGQCVVSRYVCINAVSFPSYLVKWVDYHAYIPRAPIPKSRPSVLECFAINHRTLM